ncbi:MAG: hypothetical protein IJQ39_01135 [Thermoguttaceae bacterium]|nr:hypothetical protein [Thermoguttaceae bacterium]
MRTLTLLISVVLTLAFACQAAPPTPYDADFVKTLREMRLYRLGESYIAEKLTADDLSDNASSELTSVMIELLGEESLCLPSDKQGETVDKAKRFAEEYLKAHSGSPFRIRVLIALALNDLNAGELGAMNVQLFPGDEPTRQTALTRLRQADDQIRELTRIFASPSNAQDPKTKQKVFSDEHWQRLKNQTAFFSARRALAMAKCYPENSPEYSDCVIQANAELKTLGSIPSTEPLCWQARLLRVRAERMSGDVQAAQNALSFMLEEQKPPIEMLLDFQAEKLYVLMSSDRSAAVKILSELEQSLSGSFSNADTSDDAAHLAVLDAFVTFEKESAARGDKNEQKKWQDKATQWAGKMRLYDSGFYARSAQQVLAALAIKKLDEESSDENAANTQAPSTIVLAAENLFREGQFQKAIDAYVKAATREKELLSLNQDDGGGSGNSPTTPAPSEENVFNYRYVAAAIAHKLNDHVQAADLFRQAALGAPKNPKAAQAFKTALFHAGKLVDVNKPETIERYSVMLDEFLKTFPDSPDVNLIRQQKQRLSEAIKTAPKTPAQRLLEAQTALKENRSEEALTLFKQLAKEFPNTQDIQIGFAEALSAANADQDALNQWRKVALNVKQYSPEWYRAKYEVASLLVKTGQKDKAVEMVRLLKLLRPDLGGAEWSEKFEKLLLK